MVSIDQADNLVVIKTVSGMAMAVPGVTQMYLDFPFLSACFFNCSSLISRLMVACVTRKPDSCRRFPRDVYKRQEVIQMVMNYALSLGFHILGIDHSPIRGPEGNIEYLDVYKRQICIRRHWDNS